MAILTTDTLNTILGRSDSFLSREIETERDQIAEKLSGARILVIGASGSIGGAFVTELVKFQLGALHLIDLSENNMVEVVRDLRSSGQSIPVDFKTYAIDFGGLEMKALLEFESYDYVLNFAAMKHVRSERDPFTLMRLLDVNVLANTRLLDWLENSANPPKKVFSVSSDKAVRSGNLMGASKAFMERVFLSRSGTLPFSSARFANVAFSDGSLLHGFGLRIEKRQPISAPSDVRRYFISHEEAGQLCLLGCFACKNREIVFPNFRPEEDMMTFSEIAKTYLKGRGLTPIECASDEEALVMAEKLSPDSKEWPCHFSGSDTGGEKMFEEFVDPGEQSDTERYKNLGIVTAPAYHGSESVNDAISCLLTLRQKGEWNKRDLIEIIRAAVPEMEHVELEKNLDQKM